jgi:hypothetical protein
MTLLSEKEARAAVYELQKKLERKQTAKQDDAIADIRVSFKLDPRLTRGIYMGDRWVSPPTYMSVHQEGHEHTVEARAAALNADGRTVAASPEWISADAGMVTVTPGQDNEVRIVVKHSGQTTLKVVSQRISKELIIKATETQEGNAMQIEILQGEIRSLERKADEYDAVSQKEGE